jgi:NitT/TauT family transport system permease protein
MALISRSTLIHAAKGLFLVVLLLVIWETAALLIGNSYILPTLGEIIVILLHPAAPLLGGESLLTDTASSIFKVLIGFFCAAALAIPAGVLIGYFQEVYAYFNPIIQILRPVPPIAWVPFSIAWFGIGVHSIIFIIFMGALFPILINTIDAVHSIRRQWIDVAEMFRATTLERITTVIIPGSLPQIWTGLRIGFGIAWMCVVAAEMLPGTSQGLGFLIMYAYNLGQLQVIGAGMVVIGIIGLVADGFFQLGQARLFFWQGRD